MNKIVPLLKLFLQISPFRQLGNLWKVFTLSWRIYREKLVPIDKLTSFFKTASIASFDFLFLLICATVITTLGLLANSNAVIIGGMVIAPLMNPIMSMSFAIVTGNWRLYQRSIVTVFLGVSYTILVSYLISAALPINVIDSEIVARTAPNLIDLGIASAAGVAGAVALSRPSVGSSIIGGVAIAVALAPPLCVVGIGMGIGDDIAAEIDLAMVINLSISSGAFLLFLTNLTGMILTACMVFLALSYGNLNKALQSLLIWFLIMALLSIPLTDSLKEVFLANRIGLEMKKIIRENPGIEQNNQIRHVSVKLEDTTAYITILTLAPKGLLSNEYLENATKRIFDSVSKKVVTEMDVNVTIVPVQRKYHKKLR